MASQSLSQRLPAMSVSASRYRIARFVFMGRSMDGPYVLRLYGEVNLPAGRVVLEAAMSFGLRVTPLSRQ